jgi:hypothetical protein
MRPPPAPTPPPDPDAVEKTTRRRSPADGAGARVLFRENPADQTSPLPRLTGEGAAPISEIPPTRPLRQVDASGPAIDNWAHLGYNVAQ